MTKKTPTFTATDHTQTLAHMLRQVEVGAVILYEVLSAAIGSDVRTVAKHNLKSARRIVQREKQFVFAAERGEGLKRLDDVGIVALGDKARDHITRTSRSTRNKLHCVDYDGLPRQEQTRHNTHLAMFGIFTTIASSKSQRKLEAHIEETKKQIEDVFKATLIAFGKKNDS